MEKLRSKKEFNDAIASGNYTTSAQSGGAIAGKKIRSVAKVAAAPMLAPIQYASKRIFPNAGRLNDLLARGQADKTDYETAAAIAAMVGMGAYGGAAGGGEAIAGTAEAAADIAAGDAVAAAGGYGGAAEAAGVAGGAGAGGAGGGFFQNGNWIPTAVGGGLTLLGMNQQEKAAEEAARLAGAATDRATAENARQFNIGQENLAPWLSAGKTALGSSLNLQGLSGDPSSSLAALQSSPGYQFRLKQGRQGLDASSAARGGMGSGKAMTAASGWNQDFASNEYSNRLNQLAGLSNTGQTTGNQMANNGANYANNNANLLTNNAGYQGAAGMAGANARASGLYGLANLGINQWDKYRNA